MSRNPGGRTPIYSEPIGQITVRLPASFIDRLDRDANNRNAVAGVIAGAPEAASRGRIVAEAVARLYGIKLPLVVQEG